MNDEIEKLKIIMQHLVNANHLLYCYCAKTLEVLRDYVASSNKFIVYCNKKIEWRNISLLNISYNLQKKHRDLELKFA